MSTSISSMETLATLSASVPEWQGKLDALNGQIAQRQIELAKLDALESSSPPKARSIRNQGSTESLRPRDGDENRVSAQEGEKPDGIQLNPFEPSNNGTVPKTSSSTAPRPHARATTPPKTEAVPRLSPNALARQSSQPSSPIQNHIPSVVIKKRKTESIASAESGAPKYRTRSMIIVYYDSAVQTAFEELVKFVSGSRNSMRKAKMAAKMAEMNKAAEMEVEADDDDADGGEDLGALLANRGNLLSSPKAIPPMPSRLLSGPGPHLTPPLGIDGDLPKLAFKSTRQMGPSRDHVRLDAANTLSLGMLRGYRRSGSGEVQDVFDTLDKGLEWCQSQCEHAAHQFLREGECNTAIENIKKKLDEVQEGAEKEMERLRKEEASAPATPAAPKRTRDPLQEGQSREMKPLHMRKDFGMMKELEIDDAAEMEVDEAVDTEFPSVLFKRSRDLAPPPDL